MNSADTYIDGCSDSPAAQNDIDDAARRQLVVEDFQSGLVRAEVNYVIAGLVSDGGGLGGLLSQHLGGFAGLRVFQPLQ